MDKVKKSADTNVFHFTKNKWSDLNIKIQSVTRIQDGKELFFRSAQRVLVDLVNISGQVFHILGDKDHSGCININVK